MLQTFNKQAGLRSHIASEYCWGLVRHLHAFTVQFHFWHVFLFHMHTCKDVVLSLACTRSVWNFPSFGFYTFYVFPKWADVTLYINTCLCWSPQPEASSNKFFFQAEGPWPSSSFGSRCQCRSDEIRNEGCEGIREGQGDLQEKPSPIHGSARHSQFVNSVAWGGPLGVSWVKFE